MEKYENITDEVMIEIKHLTKIYRMYDKPIDRLKEGLSITHKKYHQEHYALNNLNFNIMKGESIGIIGTNGSGKSTLLKIITGVLNPTMGEVVTNGKIAALLELGAGFNPEYTGMENIFLNGTMMGYSEDEMQERIQDIIEFADIGEFIHQPVKTYSSGMFARLAFAVSISVEPEILIVDEALSVGDMRFQIKCMKKMKDMMKGGTTVLFVSHDINSVRRFCTRVLWLKNGTIEQMGDVNEISDMYLDYLKIGDDEPKKEEKDETDGSERLPGEKIQGNEVTELADEEVGAISDKRVNRNLSDKNDEKINVIAEILSFELLDQKGHQVDEIRMDQTIRVRVRYKVYDTAVQMPVLGVAIRGMDDDYVCGLNTLLDEQSIPWRKGDNEVVLTYSYGVLSVGGKYYFDVALFDETATVPIQYISVVKTFKVHAGYVGEGRYIIPHQWEVK